MLLPLAAAVYKGGAVHRWSVRRAEKARSRYEQLRGRIRVTDVNAPITVSDHTAARFRTRCSSRMSLLRQQLEDNGYVIVSFTDRA
jgi:hypothetical protein